MQHDIRMPNMSQNAFIDLDLVDSVWAQPEVQAALSAFAAGDTDAVTSALSTASDEGRIMTWVAIGQRNAGLQGPASMRAWEPFTLGARKLVTEATLRLIEKRKVSARPPGK